MRSIHAEEERVHQAYRELLPAGTEMSPDGLHFLGNFRYNNECWGREPGDEERLWRQTCARSRGLVVIAKDLNDSEAWDIRQESGRENGCEMPTPTSQLFYRNLRRWVYGLLEMSREGVMPGFPDTDVAQRAFETEPWVRINLKKIPGGSSISGAELRRYVETYRGPLLSQLKIYEDASIYLDCTLGSGIELLRELYPDLTVYRAADDWIYFSERQRIMVINSYHPSYHPKGGEELYYNNMRRAVQDFLAAHPGFL